MLDMVPNVRWFYSTSMGPRSEGKNESHNIWHFIQQRKPRLDNMEEVPLIGDLKSSFVWMVAQVVSKNISSQVG